MLQQPIQGHRHPATPTHSRICSFAVQWQNGNSSGKMETANSKSQTNCQPLPGRRVIFTLQLFQALYLPAKFVRIAAAAAPLPPAPSRMAVVKTNKAVCRFVIGDLAKEIETSINVAWLGML